MSSENMYTVIHQTMKRANGSHTIGNAILFECVTTITTIFPNPHLISAGERRTGTHTHTHTHIHTQPPQAAAETHTELSQPQHGWHEGRVCIVRATGHL